jgi:flagella basal body P-ring formation protein FlgA
MNEEPFDDEKFLREIDHLLESGKSSKYSCVNKLAKTRPRMESAFHDSLEKMLMAQLQSQNSAKEKKVIQIAIAQHPRRPFSFSFLTFMATLVVIALAGQLLIHFNQRIISATNVQPDATVETVKLVIATQNISAGVIITDEKVGLVSLSSTDMAEIRVSQPNREYFADTEAVVGQTAAVDIFAFTPIDVLSLGEPVDVCKQSDVSCPDLPADHFAINFPATPSIVQGLTAGDRIDMLGMVDGELEVIVENILLADIQPDTVVLASPSWQLGILTWYWQEDEPYALRLHTGETPEGTGSTSIEYTFTSPEVLPDGYEFDLILGLSNSKAYLLTGLPYPIDNVPYTQYDDLMQFWFKNLEVVSIEDGTQVTIQLPEDDAANLDYLLDLQASLTFVPDEGR